MLGGIVVALGRVLVRLVVMIAQIVAAIVLAVIDFILAILYGVLWIIRKLLPWLMRLATVALWVCGVVAGFAGIQQVYGELADGFERLLLGLAVGIPIIAAPVIVLLLDREKVWAGFAFGGLAGVTLYIAAPWIAARTDLYPALSVGPAVIASGLLVYLTVRWKTIEEERHVGRECAGQTGAPAGVDSDGPRGI